jgi:DNA-binding transcriptional LysR family regulator
MDVTGFDLNLLKAFDALYAERHVTHAGQRIGLSQSAMSGALTRLREVFKDELFVRSPTGMQPTPRADDLASPVSAALRLMRDVLQADTFEPATADHTVTLAMTDYAAFVLLPPLLARLAIEAPASMCGCAVFSAEPKRSICSIAARRISRSAFPLKRRLASWFIHCSMKASPASRGMAIRPLRRAQI